MKAILSLILATAFCLTSSAQTPGDAVAPSNNKQEVLITKEFRVFPEFFGASTPKQKSELLSFFKSRDVSFSDKASVSYGAPKPDHPGYLILVVSNNQKQLDRFETLIDDWHKERAAQ
jgi:hypothetical protein